MVSDYVKVSGTTGSPYTNVRYGECGSNPCIGPDVFYEFTAPKTGTAHVLLDTLESFSGALCYRAGACSDSDPDDCSGQNLMDRDVELDFPVTMNSTYNLIVDSYGTSATGPFEFTIWIE